MTTSDPIQSILGGSGKNGRRRPGRARMGAVLYVAVEAGRKSVYMREAEAAGITISEMVRRAMDDYIAEARRERRRVAKTPEPD